MTTKYSKLYISLKFRLKGEGMYEALRALETAKKIHETLIKDGVKIKAFRKDGVTPSFQHQLEIALDIFTLKGLIDLEGAIIAALLHDTDEDYPHKIPTNTLLSFGSERQDTIRRLNKHTFDSFEDCLNSLANDPIGSIVKGCDRFNNFQSMYRGKFPRHKVIKYRDDVVNLFLPMLKQARLNFPQQMDAYYNIETRLKSQLEFVNLLLDATFKATPDDLINPV